MANNALPLPFPYVPGQQDPDSFEDRVQQNFDAVAVAIGGLLSASGLSELRVVVGAVDTTGTVISGNGFTPTRTLAGNYSVAFSQLFTGMPFVMLSTELGTGTLIRLGARPTASGFTVRNVNLSGTAQDAEFYFVAIGPR